MFVHLIILILFSQELSGYIISLNKSDYARMPPVFHLDEYESCLHENNGTGVYCHVTFDLVPDGPSELYDMIRNYSAKYTTHFNHTKLTHGICLTRTCNKFYKQNTTTDLASILETCLNETFWREYRLKTRVIDKYPCEKLHEKIDVNTADITVASLLAILLIVNLIGSLQEFCYGTKKRGNPYLACFSIRQNWRRLVAPSGEGPDPRLNRLTGFYGIKTLTVMLVLMCHSLLPAVWDGENIQYYEEVFQAFPLIANGTLVVQSFFVMSGFLLLYNMLIDAEKHKPNWLTLPNCIINRWMRLTPSYMVVLAVTATWLRHFGSGPLWQDQVLQEVESCQHDWWLHLLYANNYYDHSYCMLHTWYMAADFQLYCLGVLVYVLTRGRWRQIAIGLLLAVGVILPAAHTYFQDLDGILLLTPEASRTLFKNEMTFHHTYKRGHTNLASFAIGLALGMIVYHMQNNDNAVRKVAKYRSWFLLSVPWMLGVALLGNVFYRDAPRDSVYLRTVYGGALKPMFSCGLSVLIIGMVFKFEKVYRNILEWNSWAVLSRLSYCAYISHLMIIKLLIGTRTRTVQLSTINFFVAVFSCLILSFLAAVALHLLVEAPFYRLIKVKPKKPSENHHEKNATSHITDANANMKLRHRGC